MHILLSVHAVLHMSKQKIKCQLVARVKQRLYRDKN